MKTTDNTQPHAQPAGHAPGPWEGIDPDLVAALINLGFTREQVTTRYSDVYALAADREQVRKLCESGKWRSMARVFRVNPEHPDAKAWPWGADIPFGNLAGYIAANGSL